MKIKFGQLDFAYSSLSNIERAEPEYNESEEEDDANTTKGVSFPPVILPDPFIKGILVFRRNGAFYSSHFCLEAKTASVFKRLSETLSKKLGEKWSPMSKEGAGYILDSNKNPNISIVSTDKGKERILCVGSFGATPKKLGTLDDFILDLRILEGYTNVVFDACLSHLVERGKIPEPPEYSIYVNS